MRKTIPPKADDNQERPSADMIRSIRCGWSCRNGCHFFQGDAEFAGLLADLHQVAPTRPENGPRFSSPGERGTLPTRSVTANDESLKNRFARRAAHELERIEQRQSVEQQVGRGLAELRRKKALNSGPKSGSLSLASSHQRRPRGWRIVLRNNATTRTNPTTTKRPYFCEYLPKSSADKWTKQFRAGLDQQLGHLRDQHGHENRHGDRARSTRNAG